MSRDVVRHLRELGMTGRAQAFLRDFLRDHCIRVWLGMFLGEKRMLPKGLLQCCILSPLLFNVVFRHPFLARGPASRSLYDHLCRQYMSVDMSSF